MSNFLPKHGMSTIVNHIGEGENDLHSHVMPIYQTSTFTAEDFSALQEVLLAQRPGYFYTRAGNPNATVVARKIAALEAFDLLRQQPGKTIDELVTGEMFGTGMGAVAGAFLAKLRAGDTVLAQQGLYGGTFKYLTQVAPGLGINVVWVSDYTADGWIAAFQANPGAALVYAESPINPTMDIVDLQMVAEIAHQNDAWLMVDNTFATPYCQRPLVFGADIVVHSTTKYIGGHGVVMGGAVLSPHLDFMQEEVGKIVRIVGGSPSPFDGWLTNMGLKTFEIRMQRHCENAMALATYLADHPKINWVNYPGLTAHPGHDLAREQMHCFGGMLSFDLPGGLAAAQTLIDSLQLAAFVGSLGNVDSLVAHPASMSHSALSPEMRQKIGITDGLVRYSVGIENAEDLIADLDQALAQV